jgi:hypothetical protein
VKERVLMGVCVTVSASLTVGIPSGAAKAFPLRAKVPARATVKGFVSHRFRETVMCAQACKVKTSVLIKSKAARQLGFGHVTGKYVVIATNKAALKARTPTKITFVLTAQARRHLRSARAITIYGSVRSVPNTRPLVNFSVGWASKLT